MSETTTREHEVLAYENADVMEPLLRALQIECREGEWVIYRHAFRWMRWTGRIHEGVVMSNCYEMFSLDFVLEQTGLECRYDFQHAAIVTATPK